MQIGASTFKVVASGLQVYLLTREETERLTHEVSKMATSTTNLNYQHGLNRLFRKVRETLRKLTQAMTRKTQIEWAA
jgi:hypothetical protein